MSKGLGKLQRRIVDELAKRECFYLVELLPAGHTVAQYKSLHRAAHRLPENSVWLMPVETRYWGVRERLIIARVNISRRQLENCMRRYADAKQARLKPVIEAKNIERAIQSELDRINSGKR
jgi:hypothetical protein